MSISQPKRSSAVETFAQLGAAAPLPRCRSMGLAISGSMHALALVLLLLVRPSFPPAPSPSDARPAVRTNPYAGIVFIAHDTPGRAGGGGGGGNRSQGPIRRAEGRGRDAASLRVTQRIAATATVHDASPLPSVLLDAKPLASGQMDQPGLPSGGVSFGTSLGPGSGGGVGEGVGTGIGSGTGPGVGPGRGGGIGGGAYAIGGGVSAPRLLKEVKPTYTNKALLERIQGTVVLEAIVRADGVPTAIRVIRSLDRGGLDEQAIIAVRQWIFEPGRLGNQPVDVIVTIAVDFGMR